jgi:hypothetical protein
MELSRKQAYIYGIRISQLIVKLIMHKTSIEGSWMGIYILYTCTYVILVKYYYTSEIVLWEHTLIILRNK